MCIRDRFGAAKRLAQRPPENILTRVVEFFGDALAFGVAEACLLYTSDAADERSSVDLGGRRIIKKKNRDDQCNRDRN